MIYGKGYVLVDCDNTPENMEEIMRYLSRHKLTREQVRIVKYGKNSEHLKLEVKTEAELKGGN